jgi:hypothetical protein
MTKFKAAFDQTITSIAKQYQSGDADLTKETMPKQWATINEALEQIHRLWGKNFPNFLKANNTYRTTWLSTIRNLHHEP